MFWCFNISEPTSDLLQNDLQRISSLVIITDVNITLKRAFLQKVTILLNSTTRLAVIFQNPARNHFREAGIVMQSYMLDTVQ